MSRCLDCGCYLEGGICSNCHEALFIQTYQSEYMVEPVSREFAAEASQQAKTIKERDQMIRQDPEAFGDLKPTDSYYKESV
jgi:hypothetical protein